MSVCIKDKIVLISRFVIINFIYRIIDTVIIQPEKSLLTTLLPTSTYLISCISSVARSYRQALFYRYLKSFLAEVMQCGVGFFEKHLSANRRFPDCVSRDDAWPLPASLAREKKASYPPLSILGPFHPVEFDFCHHLRLTFTS